MSLVNTKNIDATSGTIGQNLTIGGDLTVTGSMGVTIRVKAPMLFATDITTSYQVLSQQVSTSNTMDGFIQWEDETITWEGFTLIQDSNATPPADLCYSSC